MLGFFVALQIIVGFSYLEMPRPSKERARKSATLTYQKQICNKLSRQITEFE